MQFYLTIKNAACATVFEQYFDTFGESQAAMRRAPGWFKGPHLVEVWLGDTLVAWMTTETGVIHFADAARVKVVRG